ncbi:hypothetical protein ES705_35538 [subsurface metagenome]
MSFKGPSDSKLPDSVKRLPRNKRSRWLTIWNSTFEQCMASKTRIENPDKTKCESYAYRAANGVVPNEELGMKEMRLVEFQAGGGRVKSKMSKLDGRPHLVVPLVAIVEGVMNDLLVKREEIGAYVGAWDGIPIMTGHPQVDGVDVSANDPKYADMTIGQMFHSKMDDGKLKAEAWIDIAKAKFLGGDAQEIVDRINGEEMINLSTAYFSDLILEGGRFNGKDYYAETTNIRPDHLAILLREPGACTLDDGCGIPRTQKKKEVSDVNEKSFGKALVTFGRTILGWKEGEMSKEELIAQLTANERCKFPAETLEKWEHEDLKTLDESLAEEEVDEEAVAKAKAEADEKAEAEAKVKAQADADAASAKAKEKGDETEDDRLAGLEKGQGELTTVVGELVKTVKSMVDNQQASEDADKAVYVEALKANERCEFEEKELKDMSVDALDKLYRMLTPEEDRVVSFLGRTLPKEDDDSDAAPEAPSVVEAIRERGNSKKKVKEE